MCVAFQGVGQEGRTALYLLRCPQHRQAGFRACEICKEEFFCKAPKYLPLYVLRKHYTHVVPASFFSYRPLSDQNFLQISQLVTCQSQPMITQQVTGCDVSLLARVDWRKVCLVAKHKTGEKSCSGQLTAASAVWCLAELLLGMQKCCCVGIAYQCVSGAVEKKKFQQNFIPELPPKKQLPVCP